MKIYVMLGTIHGRVQYFGVAKNDGEVLEKLNSLSHEDAAERIIQVDNKTIYRINDHFFVEIIEEDI